MTNETPMGWVRGLPSHLIKAQVANLLGITHSAVCGRIARGALIQADHYGTDMIPTMSLFRFDADFRLPVAGTTDNVTGMLTRALREIQSGNGSRRSFSANDIAALYLSLQVGGGR